MFFLCICALKKVTGAHTLVRRGGCSFFAKALAISSAGGSSMVVIDEGAGRLRMEAEEEETVNIPAVMVSKTDGEKRSTTRLKIYKQKHGINYPNFSP